MDPNKLVKLQTIRYQIRQTCGLCVYGDFRRDGLGWGTCGAHTYQHAKHTGELRQLSIHRSGWCDQFEWGSRVDLEGFGPFREGT